jgi:hypothetical protein
MIPSTEFENIPLFAGVEEQEQGRVARRAADIHLEPGEWLIPGGEESRSVFRLDGGPSDITSSLAGSVWIARHTTGTCG